MTFGCDGLNRLRDRMLSKKIVRRRDRLDEDHSTDFNMPTTAFRDLCFDLTCDTGGFGNFNWRNRKSTEHLARSEPERFSCVEFRSMNSNKSPSRFVSAATPCADWRFAQWRSAKGGLQPHCLGLT